MRDDERRTEAGERRSKGYGFMAFKASHLESKTSASDLAVELVGP